MFFRALFGTTSNILKILLDTLLHFMRGLLMLKTVKIEMREYLKIKALAKKEGRLLQSLLTEAIRLYLLAKPGKEEAT